MELTDILSQYLYEEQHEALKADASYQAARSARNQAAEALTDTLSPEQLRLFHTYMEQENYLDALAAALGIAEPEKSALEREAEAMRG